MGEDLGEEWVVVPRERGERSKGQDDDLTGEEKGVNTWEEKGGKTWEELVAQDEMTFVADEAVLEGHRWRKYV